MWKLFFSRGVGGGGGGLGGWGQKSIKVSAEKKVSLKNVKLINDYYCRTVGCRREKIEDYTREMAFSIEIEQC